MGTPLDGLGRMAKPKAMGAAVLFFLFFCSGVGFAGDWVYETGDLRGVWGSASTNVIAVGKRGMILHFNGTIWKPMDSGIGACAMNYKFKDVWGSSATDVYAVGCFDPGGDDRFDSCFGGGGVIFHYDGVSWEKMDVGVVEGLNAVWGSSAGNVFAVGAQGTILHYDGYAWSAVTSGTTAKLSAVWGTSGSNVYAVGASGTILRYDGGIWESEASGTTKGLNAVWGSSAANVFAVGEDGTILRDQGSGWVSMTSATGHDLADVWGSAASNVYAVGEAGTIVRFNGSAWSTVTSNTTGNLKAIWGSSGSNIFAVGDGSLIIRYNGSSWSIRSQAAAENLNDVWGTSETSVFAVGDNGTILRYTGGGWRKMNSATTEHLMGIWGGSTSNVYAVGLSGTILQYNGTDWSTIYSDPDLHFQDIWGSSGSDIYVVGAGVEDPDINGLVLHFDGSTWTPQYFDSYLSVTGVWGSGPDDVFATTSFRYDSDPGFGGELVTMGVVLHFDGSGWSATELGDRHYMRNLWGSAANELHAVGMMDDFPAAGPVDAFYFDGSAWHDAPRDVPALSGSRLYSVWGRSANDVFAVGGMGSGIYDSLVIVRNTGGAWWLDRYDPTGPSLHGVWGSANGHMFAVGAGGAILRLLPESETSIPGSTWARTYAGAGREEAKAVEPTRDGGFIVAGQTDSFGADGFDLWVMKLDGDGTALWQKTLGGAGDDGASAVKETSDGGYILAGNTSSFGAGGSDAWVVNLGTAGDVLWQKAYGGSGDDSALEILTLGTAKCGQGGYVVLGETRLGLEEKDAWLMKLDAEGGVLWKMTYPMAGMESLVSLAKGKGYGYFLSGKTDHAAPGYSDFLVLRLDDDGEVLWAKTFNLELWSTGIEGEARLCVAEDGGPALVGTSGQVGLNTFAWMVKLNALGEVEWQRMYEPRGDAGVSSIQQTRDLGYIIGGKVSVGYDRYDGWLLKLNQQGGIEWQKAYGGLDGMDVDLIASVCQTLDGGYVAGGWTTPFFPAEADLWVLRLDASGLISDCSAVSAWYGGWSETGQTGENASVAAAATDTNVNPTTAMGYDTAVIGENACISTAGDLIDVPRTGLTVCYDAAGAVIPCAGTGQDGDVRAGAAWPSPRFVDNGDGAMLDRLTGLIWLKDANYAGTVGHRPDGLMTWTGCLDFVAAMNAGTYDNFGHSDWRGANINEMESLIHSGVTDPVAWLGGRGFLNVQADYWSSSTHNYVFNTNYAWCVRLDDARLDNSRKDRDLAVWPVRGGQQFHPDPDYPANVWKTGQTSIYHPGDDGDIQAGVVWPNPRFMDHGDGTVTDNLTGLMWLKATNCFGGKTWMNALATVADFNTESRESYGCLEYTADYTDWHLPNRKEMISLFDRSKLYIASSLALPSGHPFQALPDGSDASYKRWSSTTVLTGYLPEKKAWRIDLYGFMVADSKTYGNRVWPVRGGAKCQGDLDKDGDVDGLDLSLLLDDWNRTDCCDEAAPPCPGALNDDCSVDEADLEIWTRDFGRTNCPMNMETIGGDD